MNRRALLLGTTLLMAGWLGACADSQQLIRSDQAGAIRLSPNDTVLVTVPQDGTDGKTVYRGSGHQTAQLVLNAFLKHSHAARLGPYAHGFDEALNAARQLNQRYLAQITLLRWDAGTAEWSAVQDQLELKIELVDAATGATVAAGRIVTKGAITSFQRKGPQDLVAPSLEAFVASLYQQPAPEAAREATPAQATPPAPMATPAAAPTAEAVPLPPAGSAPQLTPQSAPQ